MASVDSWLFPCDEALDSLLVDDSRFVKRRSPKEWRGTEKEEELIWRRQMACQEEDTGIAASETHQVSFSASDLFFFSLFDD